MQGRDLLMLLQQASKVSGGAMLQKESKVLGGAMLLQTLPGIDEPSGARLELPRYREPGCSALLN